MSENIIFKNIFDKINESSDNINNYFKNIDKYNTNIYDIINKLPKYNLIIYIFIIFLIYNFVSKLEIRLNEILIFLICSILIYFLIKKDYSKFMQFTDNKKVQLDYIHSLIFNKKFQYSIKLDSIMKPKNIINISYLYLNIPLVDFYYNIRENARYNISGYLNSIIHSNNVIGLDYQSEIGLNRTYLNYQTAIDETKKALNELNSCIYNLPSTVINYNKFNDSIKTLHGLLNQHILNMSKIFKNDNKIKDIDIYSMPDNFYEDYFVIADDDTKMKGYMSVFNMF